MDKLLRKDFILGIAVLLLIGSFMAVNTEANNNGPERTYVNVVGKSEIIVEPDIAFVDIGVIVEDKDSKVAQEENHKNMEEIINTLKGLGIDEKDIKTTGYSLNPNRYYNPDTRKYETDGYIARGTVNVKLVDIDLLPEVLSSVGEAGSNNINGVVFDVSNREELYKEALTKAVEESLDKALAMVKPFGINNLKPAEISEVSHFSPVIRHEVMDMETSTDSYDNISKGQIEIGASVEVKYMY